MSFIKVPLKNSHEVDLVKPLKNFLSNLNRDETGIFNVEAVAEDLNKLRSNCINQTWNSDRESSLGFLEKYYDQITSLEQKCPQHELHITFKWSDAFGTFLIPSNTLSLASIAYERCCVLFNIAAAKSQLGSKLANEGTNNDALLEYAAKHFQSASGIFHALRDITPTIGQDTTTDLSLDVLNVLHLIMLAHAQELFFFKASNDNMKDDILARMANQAQKYYTDALKHLPNLDLTSLEKDWTSIISAKQIIFQGIADYYQANICLAKKEFGEAVARAQKAVECLKNSQTKSGFNFTNIYEKFLNKAQHLLEDAKKDTDDATVPDEKSFEPIGTASPLQPTPLPTRFRPYIPDPFANLLPAAVQESVQELESRKQELVRQETVTLREMTNALNGIIASLNLPASLEDSSGGELPASLKEKAEYVKSQGGIETLEKSINELPNLLNKNKEILKDIEKMLQQEEESDNINREQFKEKWTRPPSHKLNEVLKEQAKKYGKVTENAMDAHQKIQKKFTEHKEMIKLLSEADNNEILRDIPNGSSLGSTELDSPPAKELKSLMNEVETLKREREELEKEIKQDIFDDMKTKFTSSLIQDGTLNPESLVVDTIDEVYAPFKRKVMESRAKQEALVEKIRSANDQFVVLKKSNNLEDSRREEFLIRLATACDAFKELMTKMKEERELHKNLTNDLINLQGRTDGLCIARNVETQELLTAIQNGTVSKSTSLFSTAPFNSKQDDTNSVNKFPSFPPLHLPSTNTAFTPSYPFLPLHSNPLQQPQSSLSSSYSSFANPCAPLQSNTTSLGESTSPSKNKSTFGDESGFVFGQNLAERVLLPTKKEGEPEESAGSSSPTNNDSNNQTLPEKRKYEAITGEEDESNVLQMFCKLYLWESSSLFWKEKGQGILRLNDKMRDNKLCSRLVMRTTGSLKVILNASIVSGMKFELSKEKWLRFTSIDGIYLIKGKEKDIEQLNSAVEHRLRELSKKVKSESKENPEETLAVAVNGGEALSQ